jgi:putative transposase
VPLQVNIQIRGSLLIQSKVANTVLHDYQNLLQQFGMIASMSRKGDCYDNAPMESFWGILKIELVHHRGFKTQQQAIREITECIDSITGSASKKD